MLKIVIGIVLLDWAASSSPEFLALNRLSSEEDLQRQQQCGSLPGPVRKVLNGDLVTNYTFTPYAVGAIYRGGRYLKIIFSGTLISKRHILTTTQILLTDSLNCSTKSAVANLNVMEFHLRTRCINPSGYCDKNKHEKGDIVVKAKNIILPFPFKSEKCNISSRNIMIVELEKDIVNEEDVEYACLSTEQLRGCDNIRISGFGSDLNHTTDQPEGGLLKTYETTVTKCNLPEEKICASNYNLQRSCFGDHGAGAITKSSDARDQVQGVLGAFTAHCEELMKNPDQFRDEPSFDILTQTYSYLDWICFVTGICPRQQDSEMVSDYLNNETAPHPEFVLIQQTQSEN